jgi:hypothetical protein
VLLSHVKRSISSQLRRLPGEGHAVFTAYRQMVLLKRKARGKLRAIRNKALPDPETVYWIDPQRIVRHTNYAPAGTQLAPKDRVFHPEKDRGAVYGGDWDVSDFKFDDLAVTRALYDRVRHGRAWRDTEYYAQMLADIRERQGASWGVRNEADLDARCAYLDRLIESIRERGFKQNHEVLLAGETKGIGGDPRYGAEISVNIGRHGEYLFQDGRHRLAIAKALGIAQVPVKVLVRHRQWVEFREFLRSLAEQGGGSSRPNQLYQNPVHPDLQDFAVAHGCEDRFAAMRKWIEPGPGQLLDIGANLGYFCHRFEELGYSGFAVELVPQCALAADKLRIAEGRKFTVICQDLFQAAEEAPLRGQHFKVVLALNIFHHFLKRKERFDKFKQWLGRLQVDTMIFEPHCSAESQMLGAYANFGEQQFVQFILENSCLNRAELIHRCEDGRPMYRLTR